MDKTTALQEFLGTEETIETTDNLLFITADGDEYYVCTENEADQLAKEKILDSLWAFNADFVVEHTSVYENMTIREVEHFIKCIANMQREMCEDCNRIIEALIEDLDVFIDDAIGADGRGCFISSYDGAENEHNEYYIYRAY